ncbi:DUF3168 domain-containing protein [Nocardiopsis alba]|uniref:DUF3168 domain-containing protein n=1 Tax=Nocardiopsis alba TaxID=53437 RepID=UPI00382560B8
MNVPPRSALAPTQDAIYARLTEDGELRALGVVVYDFVPEGAGYPYVVVGDAMETSTGTHGRYGWTLVFTVHVWSDYRGNSEVSAIADRVVALLHLQPLAIAGHQHISTRSEFRQTLRNPAEKLRRTLLRFRIETFQED